MSALNVDFSVNKKVIYYFNLDLYHLTYEYIIKYFEYNTNQNPIVNTIEVIKPKSF